MNRDIATRWVTALRSKKFKQAHSKLARTDGSFCCLGVLCELSLEEGIVERHEGIDGVYYEPGKNDPYGTSGFSILPHGVMRWAGMKSKDGRLLVWGPGQDVHDTLAWANDRGLNFDEIADLIETNVDSL